MSSESEHDYVKDGKYNKICECVRCVRTFGEWCKKNKKEGCTTCRSKVKVIRVIECEQPVTITHKFGKTEEFESKWRPHEPIERPKHCKSCKKERKHCACNDKKDYKKDHKKDDKKDNKKDHKRRHDDSAFSDDY